MSSTSNNQNDPNRIPFKLASLEPNMQTYGSRLHHFLNTTNPFNLLATKSTLLDKYHNFKNLQQQEESGKKLHFTTAEIAQLKKEKYLVDSAVQETDKGPQIIPFPFRMSAFIFSNSPVVAGMLLSRPTMFNTIFWQWANQSVMAGINFANKNPQSHFTSKDLLMGYSAAVTAALTVAISIRKLTQPMTKSATGNKVIILNTIIACLGSSSAGYVNSAIMRQPEAVSGIKVYKTKQLRQEECIGISKLAAKQAIHETAISRLALGSVCCCLPTLMILPIAGIPAVSRVLLRTGQSGSNMLNFACLIPSLYFGCACAISIFEPICEREFTECEQDLQEQMKAHTGKVYFSKGL